MNERRVYALLFAAGPSTRMGEPKLLMPFGGQTILETVLDSVFESCVDGAVIVASPMIANVLDGVLPEGAALAINYEPQSSLLVSAKLGVSKIKTTFKPADEDGILLLACDRPQVGLPVINTCTELYRLKRESPTVLCASYMGHRDYPVIMRFSAFLKIFDRRSDELLEDLWSDTGAPGQVQETPIAGMPPPIDVDTPQDYAQLCAAEPAEIETEEFPRILPFKTMAHGEPMHIAHAESDEQINACFPVMAELRTHLVATEFVVRIRRQQSQGYRLLFLEDDGRIRALAGYRISENLPWGKFLYVDDLVTSAADRSHGYGEALMNWLVEEARRHGCEQFHLDSGVQRFAAHRFYLARRMDISAHHFAIKL
jgi:CTP:molybdopterin cytidylyltransferase MocA/GNAT superfamily N-acetyltransferase